MKHIKLKKLLSEMMGESAEESVEFESYVEIDPSKMGKNFPVQEDVYVKVVAHGEYEDNRFDHEFGTHNPGSGYVTNSLEIYAGDDIKAQDNEGNETGEVLFKKGDKIDEKFISEKSVKYLDKLAAKKLTDAANSRKEDDMIDRHLDDVD